MQKTFIPILLLLAVGLFSAQSVSAFSVTTGNVVSDESTLTPIDAIIDDNDNFLGLYLASNLNALFFIKSTDQGATWGTPVLIDNVPSIFGTLGKIFLDDSGNIGIGYISTEETFKVNFVNSTNGGTSFTLKTSSSQFDGFDNHWSGDGDNLFMAYADSNGEFLGAIVSNDFGTTWSDEIVIAGESGGCVVCQFFDLEIPFTEVHGMNYYVTYFAIDDFLGVTHTYFARSTDDGATWDSAIQLSTSEINNAPNFLFLDEDAGELVVTWEEQEEHFFAKSTNGGMSFNPLVEISESTCSNDKFWGSNGVDVIFLCAKTGGIDGYQYKHSTTFGDEFTLFTQFNGTDGEIPNGKVPSLDYSFNNVFSVWELDKFGNNPKFISYSDDAGATFNFEFLNGLNGTELGNEPDTTSELDANGDFFFGFFRSAVVSTLSFVSAFLLNTGGDSPDTTAPIISTLESQPIQIIEDSVFDFTDHVICLDDIDGDISVLMIVTGDVLNTGNRGSYLLDFECTDVATNTTNLNDVLFIVVKKAGGSGGSTTQTESGVSAKGGVDTAPSLSDIPTLSFQPDTQVSTDRVGTSIADLFASLFDNRIIEGITTPVPASQVSTPSPTVSDTVDRQSAILDSIRDFFRNLFG